MSKRLLSLIALFSVFALALPYGGASLAQTTPPRPDRSVFDATRPQLSGEVAFTPQSRAMETAQRSGPTKVVIAMDDLAAVEVYTAAQARSLAPQDVTAAVQTQLARIEAAQQRLVSTLSSAPFNAQILYRNQRVYNGVAAVVDATQLAAIRQLPGVRDIWPLVTKTRDNASSVPFIGAPELWERTVGPENRDNTGIGITIGIIDTGIDYLHTDFGGPGEGYDTNDTTIITDDPFPTTKVAGGYDFAGDDYNADPTSPDYQPVPHPDPDPMDCNGHGTHVAGTAAGYGVRSNGETYTGDYDEDTPFDSLKIGPGVAPEATVYALKVFGCEGSTDVTDAAIEWAVDPNQDGDFSDHLDVINMSLGSQYGGPFDSSVIASDNAAAAGVVVVASAGNSGDTYYITGSPATSSRTISVASSVDGGLTSLGVRVNSPANIAGTYLAQPASFGPELTAGGITADVVYPATNRNGCAPFPAGTFAGKIALIDRGACEFSTKVYNAQVAGAVAVIIVNNVPGEPIPPGPGVDAPKVTIPSVMISQADGQTIKTALAAGETVNVTLSSSIVIERPELADTLSSFSSRGPRRNDSFLKPDIAAPGQNITSAETGTGDEALTISGTSMAAPHIAGSMALLRQMHPHWSVEELKALAMNTATNDVYSRPDQQGPVYGPGRVGAGRVTLPNARSSRSIAYVADNSGMVSVSFGAPEVVDTATATRSLRIANKSGSSSASYTIDFEPVVDMPGVEYTLSRTSLTLGPNGYGDITITMTADADAMKRIHDPTVSETQVGLPRHWLGEESGYVTITPTVDGVSDSPELRVPVHAVPRPASDMRAASNSIDFSEPTTVTNTIELTGRGVLTGTDFPTDTASIVTAYELQHVSPDDPNRLVVRSADLRYVGVASDYAATNSVTADTEIFFGIATHDEWQSPNIVEFDIYIDTDEDGTDDYVVFNTSLGPGGDANDVFVSALFDLSTGQVLLQDFLNGVPSSALSTQLFNSSVMALPVFASDLGLGTGNTSFNYTIVTFSRDNDIQDDDQTAEDESIVDITPTLSYDIALPGLDTSGDFAGVPAYLDLPGEEIPVRFSSAAFAENESLGVLLLHHHNTSGRQSEFVTVQGALFNMPHKLYLPEVFR